jgi:hypothetical protein
MKNKNNRYKSHLNISEEGKLQIYSNMSNIFNVNMNIFKSSNLLEGHARHSKANASRVAPVRANARNLADLGSSAASVCKGKKWLTALRKKI